MPLVCLERVHERQQEVGVTTCRVANLTDCVIVDRSQERHAAVIEAVGSERRQQRMAVGMKGYRRETFLTAAGQRRGHERHGDERRRACIGQRAMVVGRHELRHLVEHRGIAHQRTGPRADQRRRPRRAAAVFLCQSPDDRGDLPHQGFLRRGSRRRLVFLGDHERRRHDSVRIAARATACRCGRQHPVAPFETAILAAAPDHIDTPCHPRFPQRPRGAMQSGSVGDASTGRGDFAREQKLDRRSDGSLAPHHVRARRHAEILHRHVEHSRTGIERHTAARDGQAERPPRRGVEPARRTTGLNHQRVSFEADLRTVLMNQGEADDRLDGNRDRDSGRRAIPAI